LRRLKIVFEPYGRRLEIEEGESILEAARRASIGLRSECGGLGLCGRCRVIIDDLKAVSPPTEAEGRLLTPEELERGVRLACQTRIHGDLVINIPPESRVEAQRIEVKGLRRAVELEPMIWKLPLKLERPKLGDRRGDLERVLEALGGDVDVEWEAVKELPEALRGHHGKHLWISRRHRHIEDRRPARRPLNGGGHLNWSRRESPGDTWRGYHG